MSHSAAAYRNRSTHIQYGVCSDQVWDVKQCHLVPRVIITSLIPLNS
jgi:hypothetical protein